ncbi:Glutamate-1-semialdehyde 2,1-aminomutase 1, chloroplastic -like protein [Gossypium arboreum]|uniref:Glutamate-1-semialdehyde 2,1-aminomutase 1, chloroplastic-like protein n=1 Tax=Gossypium arboreum TaxID=29729 RepID=A0A0B0MKJ4_GOSAR|nr:Glutamate-1-semialdehyde 2,1-aminomutase 1, chloroplastic -like protein [Gossypium arboreum]
MHKRQGKSPAHPNLTPGCENSPVRAFNLVGGQAVVIDSVKGCCVWDTDGNEYVNYVGSWGHADDDEVLAALAETMKKGTSFGTPCLSENVLAEMVIAAVPSIKMKHAWALPVPFTEWQRSSNLGNVTDPFLVKDGSGVATLGLPHSSGVRGSHF